MWLVCFILLENKKRSYTSLLGLNFQNFFSTILYEISNQVSHPKIQKQRGDTGGVPRRKFNPPPLKGLVGD